MLDDFLRLMVFLHLQPVDKRRTWIRADGDSSGLHLVASLKAKYPNWDEHQIASYSSRDFEHYYPANCMSEVVDVLSIQDKQQRRQAKNGLLHRALGCLDEGHERARESLMQSAFEIANDLRAIEASLRGGP